MRHHALIAVRSLHWGAILLACITAPALAQESGAPPGPDAAPQAAPAVPTPAASAEAQPLGEGSAPQAASEGADMASELAALKAEVQELKARQQATDVAAQVQQATSAPAEIEQQEPVRVYGFMDFGLNKYFVGNNGAGLLLPTTSNTFVFGHLNLYFDATPIENVRALVELRYTLAPNGEETQLGPPVGTKYERIDTTVYDYASPSSDEVLRLGGIFIERAWSQYAFSDLFKLQWGLYLNPFGIWNLDHGSPTLISLMLPSLISAEMFPTRLVGVHLYGSAFMGSNELGYSVHVSNGRTPLDFDFTEDKAVGARVFVAHDGDFGRLVLGASGYLGTYVDQEKVVTPVAAGSNNADDIYDTVRTIDYLESVAGFDAALDVGALRVRTEGVLRFVNYDGDKSEKAVAPDFSDQYLPNRREWSVYLIAAYRTPWRIEPFIQADLATKTFPLPQWAPASVSKVGSTVLLGGGLNFELTTVTTLKTQAVWIRSFDKGFKNPDNDFPVLFVRVVTSF